MSQLRAIMLTNSVACLVVFGIVAGGVVVPHSPQVGRVIGGNTAAPAQFPYLVSLRWIEIQQHLCGASIVRPHWIIAAAHCLPLANVDNLEAFTGAHYTHQNGTPYELADIIVHAEYNETILLNDIALLRTKLDIEYTDIVQPITIGVDYVPAGIPVRSKGWGNIYFETRPEELQYLDLTTLSTIDCMSRHKYEDRIKIHESTLCAYSGYNGRGMCHGDSGGPLVLDDNVLVGFVSWGDIECAQGKPDAFVRISSFVPWLLDQMNETSTTEGPELV